MGTKENRCAVRLLAMDVDGTLTDGSIYIGDQGEALKRFYCKDGLALLFLHEIAIIPIIITARNSQILNYRASELGIKEVYQNQKDKDLLLQSLCRKHNVSPAEIAYIGDDINDLRIMKKCGLRLCPRDAQLEIREICDYISSFDGGRGAVRDCLQYLFRYVGCYDKFIQYYS